MIPHCLNHSAEPAGWRCDPCAADLCPRCTASNTQQMEVCVKCGGFARPLLVSHGELNPFSFQQFLEALRWPFSKGGLLSIFACAVLVTVLGFLGSKARFIAGGVMVAYLFQVVRHTASGHDDFPGPADFSDYFADVVGPSWRLTLALAWIWVPAVAITWQHRPDPVAEQQRIARQALKPGGPGLSMHGMKVVKNSNGGIEVVEAGAAPLPLSPEQRLHLEPEPAPEPLPAPAQTSPWLWVLMVLGVVIAPMSLLASALKTPLTVAANPLVLAGYAVKLGRDYLLVVGFCLAVVLVELGLQLAGRGFPSPLARLPENFLLLVLPFGLFRGIGLFVRARGTDLGYGSEEAYLVPALAGVRPQGIMPAAPKVVLQTQRSFAPIELDDVGDTLAHLERPDAPAASTRQASEWLELGKAGIQRKLARPAILALRRCVEAEPGGPLAAQAWLLAARTYAEGMRDKATSDKLLSQLAQRFPETPEGKFAAARLARSAG